MNQLLYNEVVVAEGNIAAIWARLSDYVVVEVEGYDSFYVLDVDGGPVMALVRIQEVEGPSLHGV